MSLEPISSDEIREALKRADVMGAADRNFHDLKTRGERVRDIINAGERQFWHDLLPQLILAASAFAVGAVTGAVWMAQHLGK